MTNICDTCDEYAETTYDMKEAGIMCERCLGVWLESIFGKIWVD